MTPATSAPESSRHHGADRPRRRRHHRARVASTAVIVLASVTAVSAYLFQPWKLWVDEVVVEPAPGDIQTLAMGGFVSHEHPTSGAVRLLRLPDGAAELGSPVSSYA